MRELPETERPYEKCLRCGPEALSDAELLAVIIRSGTSRVPALDLTRRLLRAAGGRHPLAEVFRSSVEELTAVSGIGPVKAVQLQCAGELARRLSREETAEQVRLGSPASVAGYFMEEMRRLPQEEIRAAFFDTRHHLIREILITRGTVSSSIVTPREVFLAALRHRAVFVVLLHNHPSGDPTPSPEDILLTKRMAEAGEVLAVPLVDHIVIGDGRYVSLKEQGLL